MNKSTKRVSKEEFIDRANKVHNYKYDYSKVVYKNTRTHVIVNCSKHGDFIVRPDIHIDKRGCRMCGNDMLTKEEFIEQSNKIHGNIYDYSESNYINKRTKITIICSTHGKFQQSPQKHLSGQNCPKCSGRNKNNEDVIKDFIEIHGDKYDYSLVDYKKSKLKLKIICKEHGIFEQSYGSHISKSGCPKCGFNISIDGDNFIKSFNNDNIIPEKVLNINNKRFKVDGYDPTTKTIYEYFGSFWHGHPDRKDLVGINPHNKIPYTELYQKTLDRIKWFEDNDYKIIYKWGR